MSQNLHIPESLLQSLRHVQDFDETGFLSAHQQSAVTSIRLHPLKGNTLFESAEQVPWCPEGRYLNERPVFTLDPAFHGGGYYVQEASSMFLDYLLRGKIQPGARVLDLCAAPGGKTTLLASLLPKDSLLIANEVIRTRVPILEENLTRWGQKNTWISSVDAARFGALTGYFDFVLVDAPCSGSGLFRKDAAAIEEWSESNVELCQQRQKRILADVWPALKEGGTMIYATCSFSAEENEQMVQWLCTNLGALPQTTTVPNDWGIVQSEYGYRFFPDQVRGEGFFIAAVKKTSAALGTKNPRFKHKDEPAVLKSLEEYIDTTQSLIIPDGEEFALIDADHLQDYFLLKDHLYMRRVGLPVGNQMGKHWQPSHDLALSVDLNKNLPTIEVDREAALLYLKKEDPGFPVKPRGKYLVTYRGLGLGWVKSIGNRYNNNLPKHWRIRMQLPE